MSLYAFNMQNASLLIFKLLTGASMLILIRTTIEENINIRNSHKKLKNTTINLGNINLIIIFIIGSILFSKTIAQLNHYGN